MLRSFTSLRHASGSRVGFIGLGNMGGPMAANLIKKGNCDLFVYDVSEENLAVAKKMAHLCDEKRTIFMDSPVSGGVGAATAGTLSFMLGGPKTEIEAASSILEFMGAKIFPCGDVGTGQVAKICNNMMLGISMAGISETLNLGTNLGLDPKVLSAIINAASGRCWSSDTYNPVPGVIPTVPSSNGYKGGFGTTLMTKDLGLAQDAATASRSPIPLGSIAHQTYRLMSADARFADKDFSSVYAFLAEEDLIKE